MKIQVFCNVTCCRQANSYRRFGRTVVPWLWIWGPYISSKRRLLFTSRHVHARRNNPQGLNFQLEFQDLFTRSHYWSQSWPYEPNLHTPTLNITLPLHLDLPSGIFCIGFVTKFLRWFLISATRATCPPISSFEVMNLNIWWRVNTCSFSWAY
jgi:hypothetical protein